MGRLLLLAFLLSGCVQGRSPRLDLQFNIARGGALGDAMLTTYAVNQPGISEVNPLWRGVADKPYLILPIAFFTQEGMNWLMNWIAKEDETAAFWGMVGQNVMRGAVIGLNLRTLHGR